LDDDVERLRAKKKSYEESEREAGLEFGEGAMPSTARCCASPARWRRSEGKSKHKVYKI
jgi:hypothetical protein